MNSGIYIRNGKQVGVFIMKNKIIMKIEMHCPKCHKPLIKGKDREFETLSDHVCDPNREHYPLRPTWVCNNVKCECGKTDIFWDEMGEYYSYGSSIKFENKLHSAYPSFARKMDIEIYKKGLKSKIYLPAFLMLWFLQPMIEFTYKADDSGKVLSRGLLLHWLKKDSFNPFKKDSFGYHTHYSFPIMNILHHFQNEISCISKCSETFKEYHFKEAFKPIASWDKRWWRHFELWLFKIVFRKWYLKSLTFEKRKRH